MSKKLTSAEQEFKDKYEMFHPKIMELVSQASDILAEAEKLAEDYAIPFEGVISRISQTYVPKSFIDTASNLDKDFLQELVGTTPDDAFEEWQHSQFC